MKLDEEQAPLIYRSSPAHKIALCAALAALPGALFLGMYIGALTISGRAVVVAAPQAEPPPPSSTDREAPDVEDGEGDVGLADRLAQRGLEAYVKGQYPLSMKLCVIALEMNEHQPIALRVLGALDCKFHNREGALETLRRSDPQHRNFIRTLCHSEGVELPES